MKPETNQFRIVPSVAVPFATRRPNVSRSLPTDNYQLPAHSRAFTLIELMVAIGIMVILASMLAFGIGSMRDTAKKNATRLALQSAEGIFSEWKRSAGPTAVIPSQAWSPDVTSTNIALPGDMTASPGRDSQAVRFTRGFLQRMMQNPVVRQTLTKMPSESFVAVNAPAVTPFNSASGHPFGLGVEYQVSAADTRTFVCISIPTLPVLKTDAPTFPGTGANSATYWLQTSIDTPVMVDSWRNPILFVPRCGFVAGTAAPYKLVTSQGTFNLPTSTIPAPFTSPADPEWMDTRVYVAGDVVTYPATAGVWRIYRCTLNHTAAAGVNSPLVASAPWAELHVQPFFASAGADENFANTDDNIYSFEK